jgi:hypothetical protein
VLAGAALPVFYVGAQLVLALVLGMPLSDLLTGAGYSLFLVAFLVLPCTAVLTVVGLGVLLLARRLPPRGRPGRAVAVVLATLGVLAVTTAAATVFVGGPSGAGTSWASVIASGAVLALGPTALAVVALLRWRPRPDAVAAPAPAPDGPAPVSPPSPPAPAPGRP